MLSPAMQVILADDYKANSVTFNGTSTSATKGSTLSGVSDGKSGVASIWFKNTGAAGIFRSILTHRNSADTNSSFGIGFRSSTDHFYVFGSNAAGTNILLLESATTYTGMSSYKHGLISWNLATSRGQVYVNDANDTGGSPTLSNDTIAYTDVLSIAVGKSTSGSPTYLVGDYGDLQIFLNVDVDISIEANRRFFIDGSGNAVDPAVAASALGPQDVLLTGDASKWFTNAGRGGGFTPVDGTLKNATSSPS